MALFGSMTHEVVTSYSSVETLHRGVSRAEGLDLSTDKGSRVDLSDQFVLFQLSDQDTGPTILEASQISPKLQGSPDQPDVLSILEMLTFHLSRDEQVEQGVSATLRINFGKDESSSNKTIDTVFWALAAGLDLYDQWDNRRSETKDLQANFHKALGNRPIEIPGGLGRLSFEVVKHEAAPWWRQLLGLGKTDTAKKLVSVFGFPAVTLSAIRVIDELLERLIDSSPEILFRSIPMRLALSGWAREKYTGGNPRIRMGVLNPGFCVLARGRDYETIRDSDAVYYPQFSKLVPASVSDDVLLSGRYDDPFDTMTYAVLRVGMKETLLQSDLDFSG